MAFSFFKRIFSKTPENLPTDPQELYELAVAYAEGKGVRRSPKKAVECFTLAAEGGHREAQFCLGILYYKDEGGKGAEYFSHAADGGHAEAQFYLGYLYVCGDGVPQSNTKAVEYFTLAAEGGCTAAQNVLGGKRKVFYRLRIRLRDRSEEHTSELQSL